jgi:lysozyme
MLIHSIEDQLILHEGLRLKPYRCTEGKLTIGVGRNLDDRGINKAEALYMLDTDINLVKGALGYQWYHDMDPVRKKVIIDMVFNLGLNGFLQFQKMIKALQTGDYLTASKEMLDSKWANQVGSRAVRLSKMLMTGEDYRG